MSIITIIILYTRRWRVVERHNGGQAAATRESTFSYVRHAVGNRDGGQAAATIESIASYARHAVGNRDGGQAAATIECFKY